MFHTLHAIPLIVLLKVMIHVICYNLSYGQIKGGGGDATKKTKLKTKNLVSLGSVFYKERIRYLVRSVRPYRSTVSTIPMPLLD